MSKKSLTPLDKSKNTRKNYLTGFTLLELVIVIVIIGILSTLALTQYGGYREGVLDQEAQVNLRLILAAERIYRMEIGGYYTANNIADINTNLKLLLSAAANRSWDYLTTANNTATPPTCCAQATRFNGPDSRNWRICNIPTDAPVEAGTCPCP